MQKKRSIKNIILKSITYAAVVLYLLAAMSYDDATSITVHVCVMFVCTVWFGLIGAANNWGWGWK